MHNPARLHPEYFYSHVNFSVTKIVSNFGIQGKFFYSHVNFSFTKIIDLTNNLREAFTVT